MRVDPGEQGFELARGFLVDVDEVESPGFGRTGSLHLHERCARVGRVDEQQVLARRDADEDHERQDDEDDDTAQDTPGCELTPQNRNRFSPPSTTRVCPVTYRARS